MFHDVAEDFRCDPELARGNCPDALAQDITGRVFADDTTDAETQRVRGFGFLEAGRQHENPRGRPGACQGSKQRRVRQGRRSEIQQEYVRPALAHSLDRLDAVRGCSDDGEVARGLDQPAQRVTINRVFADDEDPRDWTMMKPAPFTGRQTKDGTTLCQDQGGSRICHYLPLYSR